MADSEDKPKRARTGDEGLFVVGEPDSRKGKKVPVKVSGPFTSRGQAVNFQRKCENPEAAFILKIREVDGWRDKMLTLLSAVVKRGTVEADSPLLASDPEPEVAATNDSDVRVTETVAPYVDPSPSTEANVRSGNGITRWFRRGR